MKGLPFKAMKIAATGIATLALGGAAMALNLPLGAGTGFLIAGGLILIAYAAVDKAMGGN